MSDLISRRDVVTIPVMPKEHRQYQTMNIDDAYELGWYDLQDCIESLPSAEVKAESATIHNNGITFSYRKTGKWGVKLDGDGWNDHRTYTCSECGQRYTDLYPRDFCPNCGSHMVSEVMI